MTDAQPTPRPARRRTPGGTGIHVLVDGRSQHANAPDQRHPERDHAGFPVLRLPGAANSRGSALHRRVRRSTTRCCSTVRARCPGRPRFPRRSRCRPRPRCRAPTPANTAEVVTTYGRAVQSGRVGIASGENNVALGRQRHGLGWRRAASHTRSPTTPATATSSCHANDRPKHLRLPLSGASRRRGRLHDDDRARRARR